MGDFSRLLFLLLGFLFFELLRLPIRKSTLLLREVLTDSFLLFFLRFLWATFDRRLVGRLIDIYGHLILLI